MSIYLISNNLLSANIKYNLDMNIEEKKSLRTISVEGSKLSNKININNIENIYSSKYISSIETAKYLAEKNNIDIVLKEELSDCLIGNLKNQSLKMLSYFQEHDFDYKLPQGESLKECGIRIENIVNDIKLENENAVVFMPRRAIFSYLAMHCDTGFNLDERLVLTKNDEIIMDASEASIEVFKLTFDGENLSIKKEHIGE